MNRPEHLPRCEADLDEWSVYGDALLLAGDPKGDWIARDLALPATPSTEQRATLAEFTQEPRIQGVQVVWSLGHVKQLVVGPAHRSTLGRRRIGPPSLAETDYAIALLADPIGRVLEHVELPANWTNGAPGLLAARDRLFAALPPTCTHLTLYLDGRPADVDLDELLALIPAHVRTLALPARPGQFTLAQLNHLATDRFAALDLIDDGFRYDVDRATIAHALDATSHLRIRMDQVSGAARHPRCVLGGDGEGALVHRAQRRAVLLRRWDRLELQVALGIIGAREWLARTHPETYWIAPSGDGVRVQPGPNGTCGRRGDAWTCEPLPRGWELVTGDVDRITRELFA